MIIFLSSFMIAQKGGKKEPYLEYKLTLTSGKIVIVNIKEHNKELNKDVSISISYTCLRVFVQYSDREILVESRCDVKSANFIQRIYK